MVDILTTQQRSLLMSKVKSANTSPEVLLRKSLHHLGYRYKLHDKRLLGRPDIVFPKFKTVVFVNGCFWHQHLNCSKAKIPESNNVFWSKKLKNNAERDKRIQQELLLQGWKVLVIWECGVLKDIKNAMNKVISTLGNSGKGGFGGNESG